MAAGRRTKEEPRKPDPLLRRAEAGARGRRAGAAGRRCHGGVKPENERGTENIQKHERVKKVFFLLAIEILSSDFLL